MPFADHYRQFVIPKIKELEQVRIASSRLTKLMGCFIKAFLVFLLIFLPIPLFIFSNSPFIIFFSLCAIAVIAWKIFKHKMIKDSPKELDFKSQELLLPEIIKFFGKDFSYNLDCSPLSLDNLKESKIIPAYEKFHCKNHISGSYKGVNLKTFEADLSLSKFQFIVLDLSALNQSFSQTTFACPTKEGWINLQEIPKDFEKIRMNDPLFENEFAVYSKNSLESDYLLTPAFTAEILNLSKIFNDKVSFSFFDKKLLIVARLKYECFKFNFDKTIPVNEDIKIFLQRMCSIFGVIDALKPEDRF